MSRAPRNCRVGHGRYALGQSIRCGDASREHHLIDEQGFGVTSRSTSEARKVEPTGIVCFRQADVGEYLREVCAVEEMSVEYTADRSIGGYSFHNDVASFRDADMQREGNGLAEMAASKDLQVRRCSMIRTSY